MAKFDRATKQLKARVQFVRGTVRKAKGAKLTDAETDTMTDDNIENEITLGTLEEVDREADTDPGDGQANDDPAKAGGGTGKAK